MADSIREQIIKDVKTKLALITTANGFGNTIASVQRPEQNGNTFSSWPMVIVAEGDEGGDDGPVNLITKTQQLLIVAQTRQDVDTDSRSANEVLNSLMVDIHKQVMGDRTRNGLALDTKYVGESPLQTDEGQPELARVMEFEVSYRHHNQNPAGLSSDIYTDGLPTNYNGLVGWWKANDITGLNDGEQIATWPDKSAQGNDLAQSTPSLRPTFQTNILNGKAVARFTIAQYIQKAFTLVQPTEVIAVYRHFPTAANGKVINSFIDNNVNVLGFPVWHEHHMYAGIWVSTAPGTDAAPTSWHIFRFFWNGASSLARADNEANQTGTSPGTTGFGGLTLGARGTGSEGSNIDVAEIIMYSEQRTEAEITELFNGLDRQYAIL